MINDYKRMSAQANFDKAKKKARISGIMNAFAPDRQSLLSFDEVREIIKPRSEAYRGIRQVPIANIVGSEGRYKDFSQAFAPKKELLRRRWENIDMAHSDDVYLPPVRLYEIGGVFFVRDGNHRVSVARSVGAQDIDAEVSSLDTDIQLAPGMTPPEIKTKVIEFERDRLFQKTDIGTIISPDNLVFTATGRYGELLKQIEVHKYFLNQDRTDEIPFAEAAASWHANLYEPIIKIIEKYRLMRQFPGRTSADLYMWMINHWHFMKETHGERYPLEAAILEYSARFGIRWWDRLLAILRRRGRK